MNSLEKILADLTLHIYPEHVKPEFRPKIQMDKTKKARLEEYYTMLTGIRQVHQKILRYETYFESFYSKDSGISDHEALKHHIHAYLQDLSRLKEKVEYFLGQLKNDVKKIAINKDEIGNALATFRSNASKVFDLVSDRRNRHHHSGMDFADGDILDVEIAETFLDDKTKLKSLITPEAIKRFEKTKVEAFQKAKDKWKKTASSNNVQINGFVDEVFKTCKNLIHTYLKIKEFVNSN